MKIKKTHKLKDTTLRKQINNFILKNEKKRFKTFINFKVQCPLYKN